MTVFANCVEPNGKTHFVEYIQRVAGLLGKSVIGRKHKIFLTSADWALLTGEIIRDYSSSFVDPTKLPTPENFRTVEVGGVLFVNAGTEDEATVNAMNIEAYRDSSIQGFAWRRDNFIAGKA